MKYPASGIFFLFFFLLSGTVMAQLTIAEGVIIDKQTREPIELAYISTEDKKMVGVSDMRGKFRLELYNLQMQRSVYRLYISCIGYKSQDISVHPENALPIQVELERGPVMMNEVVITNKTGRNNFHTLSRLDLNLMPVRSAQDQLRMVPGLFIGQHQGGGKAEQIFLRGFDIDHGTDINITVDGLPVNMVSHAHGQGYADLHFLIPELTGTIDYGKGPYYSNRGNLGTAGYVSLNTLNGLEQSTFKLEGGQFNTVRALALVDLLSLKQKEKGTNAYFGGELLYSDGPFESPQHFNRLNLFVKANTSVGTRSKLTVIGSFLNSDWDASGQIPERAVRSGAISRFGFIDSTEGGYTSRANASIKLATYFNSRDHLQQQLYYSRYNFNLHSNFTFFLNDPINGDQIRQREGRDIAGYQADLILKRELGKLAIESVYGVGFRADKTQGSELSHTINRNTILERIQFGDIKEWNSFLYTDQSFTRQHWLFNAGFRLDHFSFGYRDRIANQQPSGRNKWILSPKFNIQYTLNSRNQLYLKTGKGFHSNDTRVIIYNNATEILPASFGADLGWIWKPGKKILFNMAFWYLFLDQEFVYVGDAGIVEPSGKTRRLGFDLSARYQINNWLFADLNINMARPRSMEAPKGENYIPLAPLITSTGGLSFKAGIGWNGSLRFRFMQNRPANEDYSVTAKGYNITDLSINYTQKKYELGIAVENIFNTSWNETQFDTETRLKNEPAPVSEIHFTPGVPFFARLKLAVFLQKQK